MIPSPASHSLPASRVTSEASRLRFEVEKLRAQLAEAEAKLLTLTAPEGLNGALARAPHQEPPRAGKEETLHAASEAFRQLVEHSPFGIYTVDADFRLAQVSVGAQRVFANVQPLIGRDLAEVLSQIWDEPFASDAAARFRHTLATGETHHSPSTVEQRRDIGEVESYDWKIQRVTLPDGRFGVVCYFYDLSERQRHERALQESERRFRDMADTAPAMLWVTEPDGSASFLSHGWREYTGQTVSEALKFGWLGAVHPKDRAESGRIFAEANAARQPFTVDYRLRRADGQYRWAIDSGRPRFGANGEFLGFIGSVVDVHDRQEALQALREREHQMRVITDAAPALISYIDSDLRYRFVNRQYELWFGLARDKIIGRTMAEVLGEEAAATLDQHITQVLWGKPLHFEAETPYRNRGTRWIDAQYVPDKAPGGGVRGFFVMVLDVTERKQAEARLRESERLNRAILDSLPAEVAVLDEAGAITAVNKPWQRFAKDPRPDQAVLGKGANYLEVCRASANAGDKEAASALAGLEQVLAGDSAVFTLEYPCPTPSGQQWYLMQVVRPAPEVGGAIVAHINITDRVKALEALRESEATLRAFYDNSPVCMGVTEPTGEGDVLHVYDNPASCRFFGVPPGYTVNKLALAELAAAPSVVQRWLSEYRACQITGRPIHFEHEYLTSEGRRWLSVTLCAIGEGPSGRARFCYVAEDITDRRHADEVLRRQATIFESQIDGIIITDLRGHIIDWNPACERMLGYTKAEVLGCSTALFHRPEDAPSLTRDAIAAMERDGIWRGEITFVRKDGSLGVCESVVKPLTDESGKVTGAVGVNRDITDRKRAEVVLRESEEKFRTLADNISQFAWMADENWWLFWYNKRWYDYTGTTLEEMQGWGWKAVHHPDHRDRVVASVQYARATGEVWEETFPLLGRDGHYRWFLSRAIPIRNRDGKVVRWFGTNTDITELRQAKEQAEAANSAKDRFIAALSHELRTPLTPVLVTASVHETSPDLPEHLRADFAMIRQNIQLEAQLIDDLLDVGRIAQGKLRFDRTQCDMHSTIRKALAMVHTDLEANHLTLRLHLQAEDPLVHADPVRLKQVIWNLLRNAAKFTPRDGEITVRTKNFDGSLHIAVSDTGIGIGKEDLTRIFDAFVQSETGASPQFGGLGLGLAISDFIVTAHGGRIWAESDGEGRGSTFHLTLPTVATGCSVESAASGADALPRTPAPLRILLVEDHVPTRSAMLRLLTRRGHQVTEADSIARALEAASAGEFDLVISDLGLPDGDGHMLMRQLRRDGTIIGIALSGYGMEEDLRASREAGFVAHLVKPVTFEKLEAALREATGA